MCRCHRRHPHWHDAASAPADDLVKRFARFLMWLVLAVAGVTLTMVALSSAGGTPPGLGRIFALVLSLIPVGALTIFILLMRSAFGIVIAIAVATMLIGAVVGLPALLPSSAIALYRGDSLGIGRLIGLIIGAALLLWGGATWIGAAAARRASPRYVTLLKFFAVVPTLIVVVVIALVLRSSYERQKPVVALPGVPSTADRAGSPPEGATGGHPVPPPFADRGNARFVAAAFDDTGTLLVTAIREPNETVRPAEHIQVWNARDGAPIATIDAARPFEVDDLEKMLDSARGRLLAERKGYVLVDLRTGREVARLPLGPEGPKGLPLTLLGDGNQALFASNKRSSAAQSGLDAGLEAWQLDPPRLLRRAPHPVAPLPNGIQAWTTTADRSTLAIAYSLGQEARPSFSLFVVDGATLEARELMLPEAHDGTVRGLAFSPDGRLLAVAGDISLVVHARATDAWVVASARDRATTYSVHDITRQVRMTVDSRRIVKVDHGFAVSVFDAVTGARVGRSENVPDNGYGSVAAAREANRLVVFRTESDTFELLDSRTADRIEWICPYVCNVRSGSMKAAAALSADGRSVAISHPAGTGVWESDTGRIRFALRDPLRPPVTDQSR